MKFAILGATGPSGVKLVQQALDKGHHVKAIVRNPGKLTIKHDNLEVVKANVFSADDLSDHVTSCDVVFSCLGAPITVFGDVNQYSEPMVAMCTAMKKTGIKRLVCLSGWYVEDNAAHPWYFKAVKRVVKVMLEDLRKMEKYLAESEDIDFTVVRPPGLTQAKMDGRDLLVESGVDFSRAMCSKLPREDLANFMLKIVEENLFVKDFIAVGLPK